MRAAALLSARIRRRYQRFVFLSFGLNHSVRSGRRHTAIRAESLPPAKTKTKAPAAACVARDTSMRVRLKACSIVAPGTASSLTRLVMNTCEPSSPMTVSGGADVITTAPRGTVTAARPAETLRKRRSNGFRRDASTTAILARAPLLVISARILSRLNPSRRTSALIPDLRVGRNEIGLAVRLDAKTTKIYQYDRPGFDLCVKLVERATHCLLFKIFADGNIKALSV